MHRQAYRSVHSILNAGGVTCILIQLRRKYIHSMLMWLNQEAHVMNTNPANRDAYVAR